MALRPTIGPKPKRAPQPREKRPAPAESTSAEAYYLLKQMQNRTGVAVKLKDGELLHGVIEWYDRQCIKLNRDGEPNLMIYKDSIKYIYKAESDDDDGEDG